MGRKLFRLFFAAGLAAAWWGIIVAILGKILPQGWGVETWWGRILFPGIYVAAVVGCYWAWGRHEKELEDRQSAIQSPYE